METSARNRLPGVVEAVKLGDIVARVDIRVGEIHIVAVITRESAEELDLKEGDQVVAVVNATEVMVGKPDGQGEFRS